MPRRLLPLLVALLAVLAVACGSSNNRINNVPPPAAPSAAANLSTVTPAASSAPRATASASPAAANLSGTVTVLAAASLTDAFKQEGDAFQQANPKVKLSFSYGASSALEAQLAQGAPADIFASADQKNMDKAKQDGTINGPDQIFAKNKLVVIVPKDNPGKIATIADLAKPGVKFVLTDPAVPIGTYARTALKNLSADPTYGSDFSQKVLANLKSEETDVRAVVAKVQTGEADAAIVYATDVTSAAQKDITSLPIPDQYNVLASYPIALVKNAPNKTAAQAFIAFVRSAPGQAILKQNNFILDQDTGTQARAITRDPALLAYQQAAPYSPSFTIDGQVNTPATYTLADLQALPAVDEPVQFIAGAGTESHDFQGVSLYDLLMSAGPQTDPARKNDLIRFYIRVTAAGGYTAVLSWAEIDPFNEGKDVLVAYMDGGQPLGDGQGMARLVVPGDGHGARYVSAITEITLLAAPLAAAQ